MPITWHVSQKEPEEIKKRSFVSPGSVKNPALEPAEDGFRLPGLIDIHIHGAYEWDFSFGGVEKIEGMLDRLGATGLTGIVPTLITCTEDQRMKALGDLAEVAGHRKGPPAIVGIYMEGPFLSLVRKGSHPQELLMKPDIRLVEKWQKRAKGLIKLITIAPELEGSLETIRALPQLGIKPCIGHTDADQRLTEKAMDTGALHVTHLFNAMRPFSHRDPTSVSAAFTHPKTTVEIIGDGIHVSPEIVEMTFAHFGPERIALISDGVCPLGMPDGDYPGYGHQLEIREGRCTFKGGHLFGGGKPLNECLKTLTERSRIPLSKLAASSFETPASILGLHLPNSEVFLDRQFQWIATHYQGTWYSRGN